MIEVSPSASAPAAAGGLSDPLVSTLFRSEQGGHEQVVLCQDRASGLKAVIALHSTALGPALGGTRFHAYANAADPERPPSSTRSTSRAACPTRTRWPASTTAAARP